MQAFDAVVREVVFRLGDGKRVLVHCNSGKGRTGLVVAAALARIAPALTASAAIAATRAAVPGAFDTFLQRLYLRVYVLKSRTGL